MSKKCAAGASTTAQRAKALAAQSDDGNLFPGLSGMELMPPQSHLLKVTVVLGRVCPPRVRTHATCAHTNTHNNYKCKTLKS